METPPRLRPQLWPVELDQVVLGSNQRQRARFKVYR
jgi:hypothetical protein